MLTWLRTFASHQQLRQVVTVATGTALSQVITFAFMPVLARIYGPDALGEQRVFVSLVGVAASAAALSYPIAIVLPRTESVARRIAALSILLGCAICALLYVPLLFWRGDLVTSLSMGSPAGVAFLMPVAVLCTVLAATLDQWLVRQQAFTISARCGVLVALLVGAASSLLGMLQPTASTLIVTGTVGGLFGVGLTYAAWRNSVRAAPAVPPSQAGAPSLWMVARQYRDFPLLRTPQNLINAFSQSIPVLILASLFGPATAGQYGLALSTLVVPAALVGIAVASVFYPRVTRAVHQGENVRALISRATLGMAAAGIAPFLAVVLFAPVVFVFVFGPEWRTAGIYAQFLAPWVFLQYINRPAVAAIPALRLQGGLLVYELFSTASKILALWIGFSVFGSALIAVAGFSIAGTAAYAYLILWVVRKAPASPRHEASP